MAFDKVKLISTNNNILIPFHFCDYWREKGGSTLPCFLITREPIKKL